MVIDRASSVSDRGTEKSPAAIAGEPGVRYLLTGTVRFAGAGDARRVQVSHALVEVATDHPPESRWAQPFNAAIKDVFAVQADIASRVATAMHGALGSAAQARIAEVPTRNPAVYDAFLRAEAIKHDSTMAVAWAGRSTVLSTLYGNSTPTPELARRALAAAERARVLAPQDVSVRTAAARIAEDLGQLGSAKRAYAEVAQVDPRSGGSWRVRARCSSDSGH